jgi:hypothetical protein
MSFIAAEKPSLSMCIESETSEVEHKELVVICLDHEGILHWQLVSSAQVLDQHYYWEDLQHLSLMKVFEQWQNKNWLIHHDSVLVHTAVSVEHFLVTKNMSFPPDPTYMIWLRVIFSCFRNEVTATRA